MRDETQLINVFPQPLREYILNSRQAIGCPLGYLLGGMLACLSIAIGGNVRLTIKQGWTEGAALYIVIIGDPGTKKSPAIMAMLRAIIDLQFELSKEKKSIFTTDSTMEALCQLLQLNPHGILLFKDEMAGLWKSMNQYKGNGDDMQKLLSFWAQIYTLINRKDKDAIHLPRPYVVSIGGLQLAMIQDLFSLADCGFRERLLYIMPAKVPASYSDCEIPFELYEAYKQIISSIFNAQLGSDSKVVYFSKEAKELWKSWNIAHCQVQNSEDTPYNMLGLISKMEAYVARLSLILEYAQCAHENVAISEVREKSLSGAIMLSEYFLTHAHAVYNSYGINVFDKKVSAIVNWLKARPNQSATARDVYTNQVAGIKTSNDALDLFTELHQRGLGTLFTNKTSTNKLSYTIKLTIK